MFRYTNYELAVVILIPIVTVLLLWTLVIFHKNKKSWRAYDVAVVAVLSESILRNFVIIAYIALQKIDSNTFLRYDLCSGFIWIFNSIHTFQAGCLSTLAIVCTFSVKLYKRQQSLRHYLTATHVIYHLFCLTTLCACVGVAAILAKPKSSYSEIKNCSFMPFQLDSKFNAFIIVLHAFLAIVSFSALVCICFLYARLKNSGFDYIKKSTSNLSELSLSTVNPIEAQKGYYDTYSIRRNASFGHYDAKAPSSNAYNTIWKSDVSNVSTTASSTNSRMPLNRESARYGSHSANVEDVYGTGLETVVPLLAVCYLFYHLPIIALCLFPNLIEPFPVSTAGLWLGLLQDTLVPVSLGLVDSRFGNWVGQVYRCSHKKAAEGKLPHVGLDGKFRHFGSQPQSLDTNQMLPDRAPTGRSFPNNEHKFPITNGSLYTSIDGRVPVIHNYRRHNNESRLIRQDANLGLHSINLKMHENKQFPKTKQRCTSCANLHGSSSLSHHRINYLDAEIPLKSKMKQSSLSQNSLLQISEYEPHDTPGRNILRLTKSYDSLGDLRTGLTTFENSKTASGLADSDDDCFVGSHFAANDNFDTMSSESSYSITTEANCDFEFYQHDKSTSGKLTSSSNSFNKDFRITRNNSKRSLENVQAYVNDDRLYNCYLHRSNSNIDKRKPIVGVGVGIGTDGVHLGKTPNRTVQKKADRNANHNIHFYAGSVPDLKKIFISDYI